MAEPKTHDEMLGYGEGVTEMVYSLEKMLHTFEPATRQQILAATLWRTLNRDGLREVDVYLEEVRLRDGGRAIFAECLMVPAEGTRVR